MNKKFIASAITAAALTATCLSASADLTLINDTNTLSSIYIKCNGTAGVFPLQTKLSLPWVVVYAMFGNSNNLDCVFYSDSAYKQKMAEANLIISSDQQSAMINTVGSPTPPYNYTITPVANTGTTSANFTVDIT